MDSKTEIYNFLIIGGTIKAATSSVFAYLSAHPEICGSLVKETFFFTHQYTGDLEYDMEIYLKYFTPVHGNRILLEASPNYLGYKTDIAPRIGSMLPEAKLLFILRNPADRLYSYYNFAKAQLQLPEKLNFEQYVELCQRYCAGQITTKQAGIAEKHLRALDIGNYSKYLRNFRDVISLDNIKIMFMEDLRKSPVEFMTEICDFADVNPGFYRDYAFKKINVTFSGRVKLVHYLALHLNKVLEKMLRQRPELKLRLVKFYKKLNQSREGYQPMSEDVRNLLQAYYAESNCGLSEFLPGKPLPQWAR